MSEKKESPWQRTPTQNLIRYGPKGTYYLYGRFGGTPLRESLKTTKYRTAVQKLGERMAELRASRPAKAEDIKTLGDALAVVRATVANDPRLKSSSRAAYFDWLDDLRSGMPAAVPETPLARLSRLEMEVWWSGAAAKYAPARANLLFMLVRRALKVARRVGAISKDPTEEMRRAVIPRTKLTLITIDQFQMLVASIRSRSAEAADWVEFMSYCGLRPGEVEALLWHHLDDTAAVIQVHGGKEGTKNRKSREVPMVPAMVDLVRRMRDGESKVGKVFTIKRPKTSLSRACERLGLPHLRVYDLRHMFATVCAQSGVDVPTFAKWLGHQDGGALAMRTYIHTTDEHGKRSAAKVAF